MDDRAEQWLESLGNIFPTLSASAALEEWQEDRNSILSFKTPEIADFNGVGKKALYITCVKAQHAEGLAAKRATMFFGSDLYKPPVEKQTADLQ